MGIVVLLVLAACGAPADLPVPSSQAPASTTSTSVAAITDPVDVAPLLAGDPCLLISRDRLAELRVTGAGEPFEAGGSRGCLWTETNGTSRLWMVVEPDRNPVEANRRHAGVELFDVRGFPAARLGTRPEVMCQVWLAAGEEQGLSVTYGPVVLNPDSCAGAVAVAGDLIGKAAG